jgi:nitrite reductase/ring-hydroxylating ferredoxin subunit
MVLRRGENARAYRNVCPHFSIPLNYEPNTFCAYGNEPLMCAHHSAMFRFEDGVCVNGPCLSVLRAGEYWPINRYSLFLRGNQ